MFDNQKKIEETFYENKLEILKEFYNIDKKNDFFFVKNKQFISK